MFYAFKDFEKKETLLIGLFKKSQLYGAQFIKVPIYFVVSKKWDWRLVTSTGGMPSSHSAAVTALSTGVALDHGMNSTLIN